MAHRFVFPAGFILKTEYMYILPIQFGIKSTPICLQNDAIPINNSLLIQSGSEGCKTVIFSRNGRSFRINIKILKNAKIHKIQLFNSLRKIIKIIGEYKVNMYYNGCVLNQQSLIEIHWKFLKKLLYKRFQNTISKLKIVETCLQLSS